MITQDRLKELLHYDPISGQFTWLVSRRCIKAGSLAGYKINIKSNKSYIGICVDLKKYVAHRLAFLYMNGEIPLLEVDHINGNGLDNRFKNLRLVSRIDNMRNTKLYKNSSSGVCGINWFKRDARWYAKIMVNYKNIHLGSFINKQDAINARKEAIIKYGFHENHGRII